MDSKKSFILYTDLIHTIKKVSDEDAGKLFKIILEYVNDLNPEADNVLLQVLFEPIRQQLKRDLKEWEETKNKRAISGQLGGLKSGESRRNKQTKQVLQNRSKPKQTEANEAVNVNVTVNDTVTVNDNESELLFNQFWDAYDKKIDVSACKKKWNNLTLDDKKKILEHVARYRESQPDKKYRKNPETYLNRRSWENEIIPLNAPEKPAAVFYQGKTMG